MLKEERQTFIIHQINLHNKVLSSDLSVQLNVSEDTIRRDLNELAESGKVLKVYGGALSKSFQYPFRESPVYARDAKKQLVGKALGLLQNGMTVLAGGGTTMLEFARAVPEHLQCTFFTVSPLVALELTERTKADVILIGGQLSRNTNICIGAQVINQLTEIRADLCLLGANSIAVEEGITDSDWEVVQVKKAMLRSANKTAILSIAEKLNSTQKMKVCNLNAIAHLVTDLDPAHPNMAPFCQVVNVI